MSPEASRRTLALDAASGSLPEGLLLPPATGGEVVLLLVDPELRGWAPEAARTLAGGWADRGRQVVLVDADFSGAILPPDQGGGREGLSDALFYGVSLEHITLAPVDAAWEVIPVGTVVPDPAQAWSHDGWALVLSRLRQENRVAVLLAPANREGVVSLQSRADRVFRVARTLEDTPHPLPTLHPAGLRPLLPDGSPLDDETMARVANEAVRVPELTRADQGTLAEKPEVGALRELEMARDARGTGRSTEEAASDPWRASGTSAPADPGPVSSPAPASPRPVRRRRIPWVLMVLLVAFVTALLLAWAGVIQVPAFDLLNRAPPAG